VFQCVAVCCSVLQCVAVCCSVLQCAAVCCSVLQRIAVFCNASQCIAVLHCVAECCRVLHAQIEILKGQLGTKCTVQNDCRADFWEFVPIGLKCREQLLIILAVNVLRWATLICSELQNIAVCRGSELQCVAECCSVPWAVPYCPSYECAAVSYNEFSESKIVSVCRGVRCSVLQCIAVCCSVPWAAHHYPGWEWVAVSCSELQ